VTSIKTAEMKKKQPFDLYGVGFYSTLDVRCSMDVYLLNKVLQ